MNRVWVRADPSLRSPLLRDGHLLDDDGGDRHVAAERRGAAGRRLGDLVHHVHAGGDLAEHGVAPAVAARVVEEGVVAVVDEELRGGGVRVAGARHRDAAAHVLEAVRRLVLDRGAGRPLAEGLVVAAALDHETLDHAVEHHAVVVPGLRVLDEIGDRLRRLFGIELQLDGAERGFHGDLHGFLSLGVDGGRQQEQQGQRNGGKAHQATASSGRDSISASAASTTSTPAPGWWARCDSTRRKARPPGWPRYRPSTWRVMWASGVPPASSRSMYGSMRRSTCARSPWAGPSPNRRGSASESSHGFS